jgi:DNA polymerase III sliding clamp (beta) subunit (PCNA family)
MKFTIQTEALKNGLEIVNHATASITTTPILENILIKVNFNNIVLTANNLEMAIEHVITEGIKIESE